MLHVSPAPPVVNVLCRTRPRSGIAPIVTPQKNTNASATGTGNCAPLVHFVLCLALHITLCALDSLLKIDGEFLIGYSDKNNHVGYSERIFVSIRKTPLPHGEILLYNDGMWPTKTQFKL